MPTAERRQATRRARINELTRAYVAVWRGMAQLVAGSQESDGRVQIRGSTERQEVVATGVSTIHHTLTDKPVLHLDATLRPELAGPVLPRLEVTEIAAAAPHMAVTLVSGRFGKSKLCQDPRAGAAENRRRANRLAEGVDYARWQACGQRPAGS